MQKKKNYRYGTATTTREHTDAAMARKRVAQRGVVQSSALQNQIGPTQPRVRLDTQHQVDAAAPRVGVDEHRFAGFRRGSGQGGREHRCACASAPCDHRENRAARTVLERHFRGVGQFGHQFTVLGRQGDDVLCADGDRGLEIGRPGLCLTHQNNTATPWQGPLRTPPGGLTVEQHRDRARPDLAARWLERVHDLHARRSGDAVDVIAQCGVAYQGENSGG